MIRLAICTLLLCLSSVAGAQTPQKIVDGKYWAAFTLQEGDGTACYIASAPQSSAPKNVRRGDIWILVTHRPWRNVENEVSFYAGYPFKANSAASVQIDQKAYKLFTHAETAWAHTKEDEAQLVRAMKKGLKMTIKGTSQRGTNTTDRFSLSGFTKAYEAMSKACGVAGTS